MKNFWDGLEKPILALAPMADVTDAAFRHIIAKYSKTGNHYSYITYTEFVSADGLALAPEEGRKKLLKDLGYSETERPIVAQFFTSKPENMKKAAELALKLGFDGVDINMGCPDKSVEKQGAGAALLKNPKLAAELIRAAKEGVQNKLPISIKTRLGYNRDELETWLPELLAEHPAAIIIHARTHKEMSKVPARWERIKRAVEIRNEYFNNFLSSQAQKGTDNFLLEISSSSGQSLSLALSLPVATENLNRNSSQVQVLKTLSQADGPKREISQQGNIYGFEKLIPRKSFGMGKTLILGNGDVRNISHALELAEETGADGIMLGRAIFGNPWLFANFDFQRSDLESSKRSNLKDLENQNFPTIEEKLAVMLEHTKLFEEKFKGIKSFAIMKKHYKTYLSDFDGTNELRAKLMEAKNASEVEKIVNTFLFSAISI